MSAIVGIFGSESAGADVVRSMLDSMETESGARMGVFETSGGLLGVSRPEWQMEEGMASGELVAQRDGVVAVADASLYYRADLRRSLEDHGIRTLGDGPGELIIAAYQAWGEGCLDHLEGDWAFILWDETRRSILAARDFGGRRPLHYALIGDILVVASTLGGVLAFPGCPSTPNLVSIAETASSLLASSHETCYASIQRLTAGFALRWRRGSAPTNFRFWDPRPREGNSSLGFDEAVIHLRELLGRATEERLSLVGPTSIQLSGGWDSTAIYAVGNDRLSRRSPAEALIPVSISYPLGDPGREDEIIELIVDRWKQKTRWLPIGEIPLFQLPWEESVAREEPLTHVYEHWNRRLAEEGRVLGTRVMLDGFGGDSLFQCSSVHLADLLRTGRLMSLAREWRAKRLSGLDSLFSWVVLPLLPRWLSRAVYDTTGIDHFRPKLERELPSWIDRDFARKHAIVERERSNTPRYSDDSCVSEELHWHLTNPWIQRTLAINYRLGLEEGVEIRSPLFDRRVIEFAMNRPWSERTWRRQTKRLLRESVRGLLPDEVLAPRPYRTGMTSGYLQRELQAALPDYRNRWLRDPVLAELGIIDPGKLQRAIDLYLENGQLSLGVQLFFTLQTELWVRNHLGAGAPALSVTA